MNPPQKQFKIILIGDDCIDRYEYVTVNRISPEAPVPVCELQHNTEKKGMAGNVCQNLKNLGCDVSYYHGETSTKKRIIDINSKQHILRLDEDVTGATFDQLSELYYEHADAIVISDYNKGFLDYETIKSIINLASELKIPIFIDTKKKDLQQFDNYDKCYIKINEKEFEDAKTLHSNLIVTRGSKSVVYNNKEYNVNQLEILDVCGAGDTFLASLAYKSLDLTVEDAIPFAIKASSITVQYSGVYAPTLKEIG